MTIERITPGQTPQAPESQRPQERTKSQSFRELLDQATGRAQQEDATPRPVKAPDPLANLEGVKPPLAKEGLGPLQTEGVMRAERALELLERYEQLLGDEKRPLKEAAKVLGLLEGEVRELADVLDHLDSRDELFPILQEVAVTAMVESIKFNRGDYLPPA